MVEWIWPVASDPSAGSEAGPGMMNAPAFPLAEQAWRDAQVLVTVDQAAACLFTRLLAQPDYYLSIARRWLPHGDDAEDLLVEVVLGLSKRAAQRAHGPCPIRDHGGYLARAIQRAAVHRSCRLRRAEPLDGQSAVAVGAVDRLAEMNLELEWGRRQLREQLSSGRIPLTLNQYHALCRQGSLDARQRAARVRGRHLLLPLLSELAERLGGERGTRDLDENAVLSLLDLIGFFEPEVRLLLAQDGRRRGRRAAAGRPSICAAADQLTADADTHGSR